MNEKWIQALYYMREINKENCEIFEEVAVYHYFRRFNTNLPFNFERHIKNIKKEKNLNYITRSDVIKDIFLEFPLDVKENIINFYLYKFHQHKVSKKKLIVLEDYLDKNREELFTQNN